MHESTVVGLSGPCHHQPPTCPGPTHPLTSVHASLGNQFRFVPIRSACPPLHNPQSPPRQVMMRETLTQSRGRDKGSWQRLHRHRHAGAGAGRGMSGEELAAGAAACRSMTGGAKLRCLIAHQTHHSDATAIRQTWDETNIWPFLTAQTPLASRHHTLDGKGSSTPVTLTSSSCRTRQSATTPSPR